MKNLLSPLSLLFAVLLLVGTACAPRTPTTVPMDDTGTTGQPTDVRAPTTAEYGDYAGRYRVDGADFDHATVIVEDGRLYGQAGNQPRTELMPATDRDLFNVQGMDGVQVKFRRNAQNRVTGMEISTSQGTVTGQKVE